MTTGPIKPELDTPPDGDFAAYVERLSAAAPPPAAAMPQFSAAAPATPPASPPASPFETISPYPSSSSRGAAQSVPPLPTGPSRTAEPAGPSASAAGSSQPLGLSAFLEPLLPLQGLLRPVRQVLLVLIVLQAVARFGFSTGSVSNLLILGLIWWALGRLALELARLSPAGAVAAIDPKALLEGLRRLAEKMKSGSRK